MDVVFKLMILFGLLEIGAGIVGTYQGHSVIASIRQPHSVFAGVPELAIGAGLVVLGALFSYAWNKRNTPQ